VLGTSWQQVPQIVSDGTANGCRVLAWFRTMRSGTPDVFLQRINGSGTKLWNPATGVQSCSTCGAVVRGTPALVCGRFWWSGRDVAGRALRVGSEDLYARHFSATGIGDTAWTATGVVVCAAAGSRNACARCPM
jgi:hypothetical protein